ncbi:MAG: 30S ribosomal protein S20 [Deltaproteobacteria bacterium]|nr:30S ribosomal protein S20 [Deltaproteobacteria bacterium]
MISSEDKRHKQNLKRHARNQSAKSRLKTLIKKVQSAVDGEDPTAAEAQLRLAASALQKAGRKRILHPNTASRRVSRLARAIHKSKSAALPA